MSKRKSVPEDLMESILSEGSGVADETAPSAPQRPGDAGLGDSRPAGGSSLGWEERPERVGITFNLSKQLGVRLEEVRQELQPEEGERLSRSELVEVALRLVVEDVREKGRESELARRLDERFTSQAPRSGDLAGADDAADRAGETVRRSVSRAGWIIETTYDRDGRIIDEDVVGSVAELPVETEYVDEAGRLVSLARDELGNTFEQVLDENLVPLETRLLPDAGQESPG